MAKPTIEKACRYKLPIYEVNFWFIVTSDIKSAHARPARIAYEDSCAGNGAELHHIHKSHDFYLFINSECVTYAFLGHEISHAAHAICDFVGIDADHSNDEAESYIVYHLHQYIYKKLRDWQIPVAHKASKPGR
jgi:hypothetical protein